MLQFAEVTHESPRIYGGTYGQASRAGGSGCERIEALFKALPMKRRTLKAKAHVFHAGQPTHGLFLVHSGIFKTCVTSVDGREKITGFRLRGDLLGMDSFGTSTYAGDAIALDTGEVWEISYSDIQGHRPEFERELTSLLAAEVRRDWNWMLTVATLSAEQRVVSFLLDLAARLGALGFSERRMTLRMTRADLGSFLALKLETVTRALTRLQGRGMIVVDGRDIQLCDALAMNEFMQTGQCH